MLVTASIGLAYRVVFAIVTRRLITEHDFFKYSGRQKDSPKIKTEKGKNLKSTESFFTSLETLYEMNIELLSTKKRRNSGWNTEGEDFHSFIRFRPDDDVIDSLFAELRMYWDGLLEELPVLKETPVNMRDHSAPSGDGTKQDNALFWPIGQEILADVARDLLDFRQENPEQPTSDSVKRALSGLKKIVWDFHRPPWRNLILIRDSEDTQTWRIRSEDRKVVQNMAKRVVKWQLGLDELAANDIEGLRADWAPMLLPALEKSTIDELWNEIQKNVHR
jgi:hypothetical protein